MPEFSAPAKLNLTLEVLRRRPDGYHEIRSVIQAIDLCDTIWLEPAEDIHLQCSEPALQSSDNLAYRAASLLREAPGGGKGALVRLEKRIPLASGLGGGSSDAAAVLLGLNELWGLALPLERLEALAARLGSDVPFFLHRGAALVEGRGERVTPLPPPPEFWAVLLRPTLPAISQKTQTLYNSLRAASFTGGEFSQRLVESLRRGSGLAPSLLFNVFESIAFEVYPDLEGYQKRLLASGAGSVHLAGSGPVLFTLAEGKSQAEEICGSLRRQGMEAYTA
ncbi:MAG: 4-(cytidine 5'-diphospho)-2-C-methyl-D-erythritol kinase, partial [Dehalococcoidia bacterium]